MSMGAMVRITARRTHTMRKHVYISLTVIALLTSRPGATAQINMQQMPNYSGGSPASSVNRTPPTASELRVVPQDVTKLRLAPGFLVSLNVLEDPDFVGSFRVDEQGNLVIPVLGVLHVAGETAYEARNQIEKR